MRLCTAATSRAWYLASCADKRCKPGIFADSVAAGIQILIGVAITSNRGALLLAGGAFSGCLVATLWGVSQHAAEIGLYGFNAGLVSVAVGQIFLKPDTRSALLVVLGSLRTPFIQIGFS